jgi:hypothetical protein
LPGAPSIRRALWRMSGFHAAAGRSEP